MKSRTTNTQRPNKQVPAPKPVPMKGGGMAKKGKDC